MAGLAAAASAAPAWVESNALASTLDNSWTYAADSVAHTATVSFHDQQATNTSASAAHLGFLSGLGLELRRQRRGHLAAVEQRRCRLRGRWREAWHHRRDRQHQARRRGQRHLDRQPLDARRPAAGIATEADWIVPLFDFGTLAAGATALYDITLHFSFDTQAAFDDWDRGGSFYLGGQGLAAPLPEPGSLALVLLALVGLGLSFRPRSL